MFANVLLYLLSYLYDDVILSPRGRMISSSCKSDCAALLSFINGSIFPKVLYQRYTKLY